MAYKKLRHSFLLIVLFLVVLTNFSFGQKANPFGNIDENLLVETKWRYTYTLHLESNTILHKAKDEYQYFLHFRYDFTYEEYFNKRSSAGKWKIENRTLKYTFKNIPEFEIADINKEILILQFRQPNSTGTYQYHFVRAGDNEAPFLKPRNELPIVDVYTTKNKKAKKKKKNYWWKFWEKFGKDSNEEENYTYFSIELTGGGYYGGIDPILRDYIHIKNDGRLVKEFKSYHNGLIVTKKNIPRDQLNEFAEYIIRQKFFELERSYDCESSLCMKRKGSKPTPIPLRLAITYGGRRKVVTVSIWGKDKNEINYVNYPSELNNIIEAIQRMADTVPSS